MSTDVVIATATPTLANGGDRLLQLATWLATAGLGVEVLALGEGTKPETVAFNRAAPTTVVDRFRRRGIAAVPMALGFRQVSRGLKGVRLRRWLERRHGATLLVHDPVAAAVIRYAPQRPARIVAAFPEPGWTLDRMRAEDRDTLADADAWLTCERSQTDEIGTWFGGTVLQVDHGLTTGAGLHPDELPSIRVAERPPGTVVLVPPLGSWTATDHAVEVAWQLRRAVPGVRFRWIADTPQDRWLAAHDIRIADLDDVVDVVGSDAADLLDSVSAVVRTGYTPSHGGILLAAALGGVPVLGTCLLDIPGAVPTPPLDVEGLVGELAALVADPDLAARNAELIREGLAHLDVDRQAADFVALVTGNRT